MTKFSTAPRHTFLIICLIACFALTCFTRAHSLRAQAVLNQQPVELQLAVRPPFRFIAYGDTRFTNPGNTEASNAAVRRTLVKAIADEHPAFICIGGDISYNGDDANDWKVWDAETSIWREKKIPVYPALGNHDLHGDQKVALGSYFQHFPELGDSRYYSVAAANTLLLVLDSSLDETSGAQGQWLRHKLEAIPAGVDFVFVVLHHPPYTSSSDQKKYGGGHSGRSSEHMLAEMLENYQQKMEARIIVFASHVHNYERHQHGGITYFVTGGGGAHAYPIERASNDIFRDTHINYHYLLVEVDRKTARITMNRLDLTHGDPVWTKPDSAEIAAVISTSVPK